ncbi:hypothetical protein PAEPH01_1684 [Pancytospora epiphaga]|nr:hypothetical protein PAEPH01_1684 [Pancytospora epiphaga]
MNYLYSLGLTLPYRSLAQRKLRDFVVLSQRRLQKLKKIKSTICKGCREILIPKLTCRSEFVKRDRGFCFETTCNNCARKECTVIRGQ